MHTAKFKNTELIDTVEQLYKFVGLLNPSLYLFFDTETTGLKVDDKLLIVSLYQENGAKASIFIDNPDIFEGIPLPIVIEVLRPILTTFKVVGHNIKFDAWVMQRNGIESINIAHDTMCIIHCADCNLLKGLEASIQRDLKIKKPTYSEICGLKFDKIIWEVHTKPYTTTTGRKNIKIHEHPAAITKDNFGIYAADDVEATAMLLNFWLPKLEKDERAYKNYLKIELPIIPVLVQMKQEGVFIDLDIINDLSVKGHIELEALENYIYEYVGYEFNIGSGKQLAEVLYNDMQCPILAYTDKGAPSTDKKTLEKLVEKGYEIAIQLNNHSKTSTMLTNFLDAIPKKIDSDGRLRGDLNSTGTVTGRFCVSEDTLITTDRGVITIGSITPDLEGVIEITNTKVLTHENNYKDVTHAINKGYEEMYEVELANGNKIECTLNHVFLTNRGWRSLNEILQSPEDLEIMCYDLSFTTSKIVKITSIGVKKVCDISVADDHSYIGNGIVCHNSSNNPNLQNAPNSDIYPFRSAYIPKPGYCFVGLDYSQVEPRILAHVTKDKNLCAIFNEGRDIYQGIADSVGVTRKQAKILVLAIMYGMGEPSIANTLKITEKEAAKFLKDFYAFYHDVALWKDFAQDKIRREKLSRTLYGRKRVFPDYAFNKGGHEACRQGINAIIQGTAADIMKLTMIRVFQMCAEEFSGLPKQLMTIHDELIMEVPIDIANEVFKRVKEVAEAHSLIVPLKVDIKICSKWSQMKDDHYEVSDVNLIMEDLHKVWNTNTINLPNNLLNLYNDLFTQLVF